MICFKSLENEKIVSISICNDEVLSLEQVKTIRGIFTNKKCFGFNTRNYDIPIVLYALSYKTSYEIYKLSKDIIDNSLCGWQTLQKYNTQIPDDWDWFDIQEIATGKASLKLYGARLHNKEIVELPYDPNLLLNDEQIANVITYCKNDLDVTILLYNNLKEQIELREQMSIKYKENLLSKSDAQIAEKIIKNKIGYINRDEIRQDIIKYKVPDFIGFKTNYLKELAEKIESITFTVNDKGSVDLPKELGTIEINNKKYKMGIGGLHSCEKNVCYHVTPDTYIIDKDVASYYPSIILNCGLYPKQLGVKFLDIYSGIIKERLKAKKNNDKTLNSVLKIVLNGSYGKFGSKYSVLYSPELMLKVTLTGQLALLMLIEELELNGIEVISANTDGVVSHFNKSKYKLYETICMSWEIASNFDLESTYYQAVYSRDVNNYLAIKNDNTIKGKGIFAVNNLAKNPQGQIIYDAVIDYLTKGIDIESTIKNCTDIRKFLIVRTVNGGAVWKDAYLGKVVRWVYSTNGDTILYKKNGNKVAKSDDSYPIVKLCDIPDHIDYLRYIEESKKIVQNVTKN